MNQSKLQTDLNITAEIKLYYDLYIPENAPEKAPLLIAVHGYGAHKRYMMREARLIAPENMIIVSIQAPYQHHQTENGYKTGFGWLTDFKPEESVALHHKFVFDVIEKLSAVNLIDKRRIFLYGFSQACALNFRFALSYPEMLSGIIGVCGGIPSDLETNEIYQKIKSDVLYLYSRSDEFYPLEKYEAFDEKLKKFAFNYQSKLFGGKHEITDQMRAEMREWLKYKS
jgi:phospholipase/carboxylesterase